MNLIVITSPAGFEGEARIINQLFDHGLDILHLRKPAMEKVVYAKLLGEIAVDYRDRIALHDHHELAPYFGTNRLHYTESRRKLQAEDMLQPQNQDCVRSTAIHQLADLASVKDFDYAFLSPVFNSFSKIGYQGIIPDDFNLKEQQNKIAGDVNQVIALGGIGIANIGKIKQMGFDGAALLGWIWNDPRRAVDNFKQVKCWIKEHM